MKNLFIGAGAILMSSVIPTVAQAETVQLAAWVEKTQHELQAPAFGAAIFDSQGLKGMDVSGLRAVGFPEAVTVEDQWHIGSIGKSITATMIARLVERGDLDWSTRVSDVFGAFVSANNPAASITLTELLSHTSGLQDNLSEAELKGFQAENPSRNGASARHERLKVTKKYLARPLQRAPGSGFQYSNLGYMVAAAMAERIENAAWEDLVSREVFGPLGMKSAGFGSPRAMGGVNQPTGHVLKDGTNVFAPVGADYDNLEIMGPAGTLHMSMADLAAYLSAHLAGARGQDNLLMAKSYEMLHTPQPNTKTWMFGANLYALGWVVETRDLNGQKKVIWHNGSNGAWYAVAAFVPEASIGVLLVANAQSDTISTQMDGPLVNGLLKLAISGNIGF